MPALIRGLCCVVAVLLAGAENLAAQEPARRLPAALGNAQFWSIVSEFSEAGGTFATDNFTSNELAVGQIAADLIAGRKTGGAYIGVGPEQNFTYIAALKPEIAFIVDIRHQAVMQHLMYKAIFEMAATRSDFIALLFARPRQTASPDDAPIAEIWTRYLDVASQDSLAVRNLAAILNHLAGVRGFRLTVADSAAIRLVYDAFVRHGPGISYSSPGSVAPAAAQTAAAGLSNFAALTAISDTSGNARSFLATEENFRVVKGLHARNLIVPVVGDFGGSHALRRIAEFLGEHGLKLTAYYVSNVEQYLSGPSRALDAFYANVSRLLLDSSSVFIRPGGSAIGSLALQLVRSSSMSRFFPGISAMPGQPAGQSPSRGFVSGTIRDLDTNRPLYGASISIMNTTVGAFADSTGRFTLANVPPGVITLSARHVGYVPQTIPDVRVVAGGHLYMDIKSVTQAVNLADAAATALRVPPPFMAELERTEPPRVLCPVLPFLAAYNAGRVRSFADALTCPR
jgi:hypothetical protein